MPPLFTPYNTTFFRLTLLLGGLAALGIVFFSVALTWSDYTTAVGTPLEQPIPFSHKHHVGGDGIDCRYCHTAVEKQAFAGMPTSQTCMTCHSQIWNKSPLLEPVRRAAAEGRPIRWNRVYRIPEYVYFNHSIHVSHGFACAECHGDIAAMPLVKKVRTFYMRDCLSCHRQQHDARLTNCTTCHR